MKRVLSFTGNALGFIGALLFLINGGNAIYGDVGVSWPLLYVALAYGLSGFLSWLLFVGMASILERLERLEAKK